jgi:hypothetical protein
MSSEVTPAEQARRDREWADYQRRAKQRLAQSWKPNPTLDFDELGQYVGKPSDILTNPELQDVEPPTRRRRKRYQSVDTNK